MATPTVRQHGPAIRALRIKDGLSVPGLAELVGCAHSAISNIELERKHPSPQMLVRIARALHVPEAAISRAPIAAKGDEYEEPKESDEDAA